MKIKLKYYSLLTKSSLIYLLTSLMLSLIWHTHHAHYNLLCQNIKIQIQDSCKQTLLTPEQVWHHLEQKNNLSTYIGKPLHTINTKELTNQLKTIPLIKNVIITKTWHGILNIYIQTKYILARILNHQALRCYIDEDGYIISNNQLPLLNLLILDGINPNIKNLKNVYPHLWAIVHYLYKDRFWRYQITSIQLLNNQKIILGTQIGNHQIEFGKAEHIEAKFKKLHLFYTYIIPYKGWHAYRRINLEFNQQLICT